MTARTRRKPPAAPTTVTAYFNVGDLILMGKYKSSRGRIVGFGEDKWGNPTVEIEPVPKGRKQNKVIGLFKIWRADVKDGAGPSAQSRHKKATKRSRSSTVSGSR